MEIVSAPWLIPIDGPVIQDGSVVVEGGRIADIGHRDQISRKYPQIPEDKYPCVILPGLVNAHMHLELSHIRALTSIQPNQNFTDWIKALLATKAACQVSRDEIIHRFTTVLEDQNNSGVILICDTGNERIPELNNGNATAWPDVLRLLEYIGPNSGACLSARKDIEKLDDHVNVTGHSPYSTGADLLVYIKERCKRLSHVFSIHCAESPGELDFLQAGLGCFRDFLEERNSWDSMFTFEERGFKGTVDYFNHHSILDENTLLVHCVHVSDEELLLIRESGAHICLCPGSNQFLGVGRPPVEKMISVGLLPALGTDSSASNPELDLWREMQIVTSQHPMVDNAAILSMATLGGAQALCRGADYGSLSPGKSAKFIHVSSDSLMNCRNGEELLATLVSGGRPTEIDWVQSVQ